MKAYKVQLTITYRAMRVCEYCAIQKRIILKIVVYLSFLLLFYFFYFQKQLFDFFKGNTAFESRYEVTKIIDLPIVTICFLPTFKQSLSAKYGYKSVEDIQQDWRQNYTNFKMNPWELLQEMSIQWMQDFQVAFYPDYNENLRYLIQPKDKRFTITPISTLQSGICYKIEGDFKINTTQTFGYDLTFNSSDIPQELRIGVTSDNNWYGLYEGLWPYFEPPDFITPYDPFTYVWIEMSLTNLHFQTGHENITQCLLNQIFNSNCSTKCFPLFLSHLKIPVCENYQEIQCIIWQGIWHPQNYHTYRKCWKPKTTRLFKPKPKIGSKPYGDKMLLWFKASSDEILVKEEQYVIGTTALIGSVGGSLSLFLGFSCYTYFSSMIDGIFELFRK